MGDQPTKIGGEPHRGLARVSPLYATYLANLVLIIVLGIVGASLNGRDQALPDAARKAALAFTIIGFLFILFAAVVEILIMLKLWISQRLLQFAVLGLMTLALICFIIATAVSYMKSETRFGDWIMSAFWLNLGCLITALGYFFVELN